MPSSPKMIVTVIVADTHLEDHVTVANEGTGSRHDVILTVESHDKELAFAGTFDDLIDFGAQILGTVYSWPILHGHSDWLSEIIKPQHDGSMTNGTASENGRTGTSDRPGGSAFDGSSEHRTDDKQGT
jgi:hypothetical protein